MTVARTDPDSCSVCGSPELEQDPDVLDTWFSSGLWPFSTLGWPEETPDYQYFYPTSFMETGYDILFFWVARMIMSGLEYTGEIPFHTVYLHGLIRDDTGRKMSKSYGNVIDPLVVMDEMGTDALRFTLLVGSTPGNDMNLSLKKVEANRNFANKLWNASRLILSALEDIKAADSGSPTAMEDYNWTLADAWIWARLQALIRDVERLFQNHQYGEAGRQIYEFFWGEFADWYLEVAKLQLAIGGDRAFYTAQTLVKVLDLSLRLLHPFVPFVTEELWGHLKASAIDSLPLDGDEWPEALIIAPWPEPRDDEGWEKETIADFDMIREIVRALRNLRSEKNVKPGQRISAKFVSSSKAQVLLEQASTIAALARIDHDHMTISETIEGKPEGHIALVVGEIEIYLPLSGLFNLDEERSRLEKDLTETQNQIKRLESLLGGQFAKKAPEAVVQKEREKLNSYKLTAEKIMSQLQTLNE